LLYPEEHVSDELVDAGARQYQRLRRIVVAHAFG
jgi:hypothetical protein